ncbi:hypothetical protein GCM10009823_10730 [Brevibacterium salitolerans]|uniref:Uncharacterized protein n=1 Tax=Brevibacterium salitolerans TaxID=1403566 RepID=A0ABN2WHQ8_9MICO
MVFAMGPETAKKNDDRSMKPNPTMVRFILFDLLDRRAGLRRGCPFGLLVRTRVLLPGARKRGAHRRGAAEQTDAREQGWRTGGRTGGRPFLSRRTAARAP